MRFGDRRRKLQRALTDALRVGEIVFPAPNSSVERGVDRRQAGPRRTVASVKRDRLLEHLAAVEIG